MRHYKEELTVNMVPQETWKDEKRNSFCGNAGYEGMMLKDIRRNV